MPNWSNTNADFGLVVVPGLETLSNELPAIMTTRYRVSHIFIVTLSDMTKSQIHHYEALNEAPVAAHTTEASSNILTPGFADGTPPLTYNNSIEQGMMTVHTVRSLRRGSAEARDRLALVCAQKYENFRRSDIDEEGETITPDIFHDTPRQVHETEKDKQGDEWKPDGWSPDGVTFDPEEEKED